MIDKEQIKARINNLIDEMRRIEGRISENQHLLSWIEQQEKQNLSVPLEGTDKLPLEAKPINALEAKE